MSGFLEGFFKGDNTILLLILLFFYLAMMMDANLWRGGFSWRRR